MWRWAAGERLKDTAIAPSGEVCTGIHKGAISALARVGHNLVTASYDCKVHTYICMYTIVCVWRRVRRLQGAPPLAILLGYCH